MSYYLVHTFGPHDMPERRRESFPTQAEALNKGFAHLAGGARGEFCVEDDDGRVVVNELQIRRRYRASRMS